MAAGVTACAPATRTEATAPGAPPTVAAEGTDCEGGDEEGPDAYDMGKSEGECEFPSCQLELPVLEEHAVAGSAYEQYISVAASQVALQTMTLEQKRIQDTTIDGMPMWETGHIRKLTPLRM